MYFTKSFLIAMVAVGALTLSACGKKKEEAKDLGAPAPTAPAPTTQPADPAQPPVQQQGSVLQEPPPGTPPAPGATQDPRADRGSSAGQPGTTGPSAGPGATEPQLSHSPTVMHKTGAKNRDGLVYTGSGVDETLEILKSRESALSREQQKKNQKLAQSIESVEFSQDLHTQVVSLSVRLKDGKQSEIYNLSTNPLVDNSVIGAACVNSALGFRTTGNDEVSGTAQCLDLSMSESRCNNVLVTFVVKKGQSKSAAQILIRSSYADVYADLKEASNNPEFAVFKDFLVNSYLDRDTRNKVESINMVSYEILNGRAAVELQILGFNKEFMGFGGELLSSESSNNVNVAFQKRSPRANNEGLHLNLLNSLGDVRLVMNDGRGRLTIKGTTRQYRNYPLDHFSMTFVRRTHAVIPVGATSLH